MTTLLEIENYGLYTLKARMITNFIRCSNEAWADVVWLRAFFKENIDDLNAYFKITDIKEAISDTIEDSERLRYIIMDISPETDLSKIFRPTGQQPGFGCDAAKRKGPVKT